MLTILESLPDGLLERPAAQLAEVLDGPTLIHLDGRGGPPLFVSVLLHGNEVTGWEALRVVLARRLDGRFGGRLSRPVWVFIGNVEAARAQVRRLDHQPDFNRIWRGAGTPYHRLARQVLEVVRGAGIGAAVDVHNTTGRNPHYAVVGTLEPATLSLAARFGRRVVYSTQPNTVLSVALGDIAPAVTVECGQPGHEYGAEHAEQFLEACLRAEHFDGDASDRAHLDLYRAVARVKVPDTVAFGFDGSGRSEICFVDDLDTLNFHEIPQGTTFARVEPGTGVKLEAWSEDGREVADRFFAREGDAIVSAVPLMPSMLTLDERAIRQDCLCYLMERMA